MVVVVTMEEGGVRRATRKGKGDGEGQGGKEEATS